MRTLARSLGAILALALAIILAPVTGATAAPADTPSVGWWVPLPAWSALEVEGRPFTTYPDCKREDGSGGPMPCKWDARLRGNGKGRSFVITDQGQTNVNIGAYPSRGTMAWYPQCAGPNGPGVCWYSANTRGDGLGRDYWVTDTGVKVYWPATFAMMPS